MNKILLTTLSLATAITLNAGVLATAGDITITDEDIAPFLIAPQDDFHGMGGELTADDKKNIVNNLVKYKLLVKEAKKSGVENDPAYAKGLEAAKDSLAFNLWQEKEFQKVEISDEEAKKFYDDNINLFMKPEEIKARHILVDDKAEAEEIIATLQKVKKDKLKEEFGKMAGEKSKDPTAVKNGGELSWFAREQMVAGFEDAAFELKDGEMTSAPVETEFGYHVILREETRAAEPVAFDEIKEPLKADLKTKKFGEEFEALANKLFEETPVVFTEGK
ncbi:MAG: foldase [Campylobacteraceae bacterium]|nr:foldase [Campylobacteraceae bacterium]